MKFGILVLALALSSTFALSAKAQQHLAVSAGVFDVLDDDNTAQFGAEYRFDNWNYGVRPTLGVSADAEGGLYGYGGVNWDIPVLNNFYLTPNFMVGAYHQGGSKDLGGALNFRSGVEFSYAFENDSRLGVTFNHISNASIYNSNPGAESLMLVYQHPVQW